MAHTLTQERRAQLAADCAELDLAAHADAVARLARNYWDAPAEVMARVLPHAPARRAPARTVGVYYCRNGIGGAERVNRDLILLWQSMGYRVVFISDDGPVADEVPLPPGVDCAYVPGCFASYGEAYAPRAAALGRALTRLGVDVLVYAQWLSLTLPWDAMVARLQGVSFVVHAHEGFARAFGCEELDLSAAMSCYAHVDAVVSPSRADEKFWRSYNVNSFRSADAALPGEADEWDFELQGFDRVVLWREVFDVAAVCTGPSPHLDPVGPVMWQAAYDAVADVRACAAERSAGLEARVAELEAANAALREELEALRGSASFKAGRALTSPLRTVRDAFSRRNA